MASEVVRLFNRTRGSDGHPTAGTTALHVPGQVDRALPPPAGDQGVERVDVDGDERTSRTAGLEREQPPDAGADGSRQRQQQYRVERPRPELVTGSRGEIIERIGVLTEKIGRP